MLSLLTLFKDLVFSVSAGFVKYFFNSELGDVEKSLGFNHRRTHGGPRCHAPPLALYKGAKT